jgi:thiamine biosynthesis lipoprotein
LRVGLEDPDDASLAVGVVEIRGESICASAGNRRRWRGLHHIVDPRTREPVDGIAASWVIAKSALEADALSTALFLATPEALSEEFSFEWARLMPDRSASFSPRFQDTFFAGAGKGAK